MNKIITILCISAALFLSSPANSQILYTKEDTTLLGDSLSFDINQDGILDFTFYQRGWFSNISPGCCDCSSVAFIPIDLNSEIAFCDTLFPNYSTPCTTATLDSGAVIDNRYSWRNGLNLQFYCPMEAPGCAQPSGSAYYYPVKFYHNGNYYFGWVHLSSSVNYIVTMYDMAINLTPNEPIVAGQIAIGIPIYNLNSHDLKISPNPTFGKFEIETPSEFMDVNNLNLTIYDNLGKLVLKQSIERNTALIKLNIESKAKGIYNIILSNSIENYSSKLILN